MTKGVKRWILLTKDEQKLAKSALGIEKNGMPCYLYNMTKAEREKYIRKHKQSNK